jgi:hypothetical protein
MGYTYCYVPEGGITSHNPIGAPLGSTSAWFRQKENAWTPQGLNGLVLWLKPENIGVCGSVANGASMDVWRDASPSRNDAIPPTWDRWTNVALYAGVTIDKLRPTLVINDNGIVGATGISFDGGVIFGPQTLVRGSGLTLGSATIGFTFAPGSSGDKLLVGRHFYLKNGLTLSADMDMFIVYRPTLDSYNYGYGFVSSNRRFTDSHFSNNDDLVVFSRSYNLIDRTTAYQAEGQGYYNFASGVKRYPPEVGILGFRPWKPFTPSVLTADRTQIAYDPHVSGQSMGMVVGEVARDTNQVLYTYVNGDRATNKSPSTGVYVTNATSTYAESPVPTCGVTIDIGRFGSYHRNDLVSSGTIGSAAWIATAITNTPYGFRGVLNEVIVFNRKLEETERQEVYGYLARKYSMDTKLPNSYTRSHPSTYPLGLAYWNIEHHPNTTGITGLSAGISFGSIALQNFFTLPDRIYKSAGTILSDQTVLGNDTYPDVGL